MNFSPTKCERWRKPPLVFVGLAAPVATTAARLHKTHASRHATPPGLYLLAIYPTKTVWRAAVHPSRISWGCVAVDSLRESPPRPRQGRRGSGCVGQFICFLECGEGMYTHPSNRPTCPTRPTRPTPKIVSPGFTTRADFALPINHQIGICFTITVIIISGGGILESCGFRILSETSRQKHRCRECGDVSGCKVTALWAYNHH